MILYKITAVKGVRHPVSLNTFYLPEGEFVTDEASAASMAEDLLLACAIEEGSVNCTATRMECLLYGPY
jgi:hypothetical protein